MSRNDPLSKPRGLAYVAAKLDTGIPMATDHSTPHFHNQPGARAVRVGAKEFMCIGALPPFDHPHIFIDMGDAPEAICPYCSTLYTFDDTLHGRSNPAECEWTPQAA